MYRKMVSCVQACSFRAKAAKYVRYSSYLTERQDMKISHEHLFTISLNKELKNGNEGRSKHWSSAHTSKKQWKKVLAEADIECETGLVLDVQTFLEEVLGDRPVQQRVGLVFTRVLGKGQRMYDSDSIIRGNAKELLDSIVDIGILSDDNTKYVEWSLGLQDDKRRTEGPFTTVSFYDAEYIK
jgi:hypothetical protein